MNNGFWDSHVIKLKERERKSSCDPITWKRTSNRPIKHFSPENVNYCQDFLDYMYTVYPCKTKCFDEAGLIMPDVPNPNYMWVSHVLKWHFNGSCWCGRNLVRQYSRLSNNHARFSWMFWLGIKWFLTERGASSSLWRSHPARQPCDPSQWNGICFGMVDGSARHGSCLFTNILTRI